MFIPNGTTDVIAINGVHVPCHPDGVIINIKYPLRIWSSTISISHYMLHNRWYLYRQMTKMYLGQIYHDQTKQYQVFDVWCLIVVHPMKYTQGFVVLCLVVVISEFVAHSVIQVINLPISCRVTSLPFCHWSTPVRCWQQPLVTHQNQAQQSPNRAVS